MTITLQPVRFFATLAFIAFFLIFAGLFGGCLRIVAGIQSGVIDLFALGSPNGIPACFTSLVFVVAALQCLGIALAKRFSRRWVYCAAFFVFLSLAKLTPLVRERHFDEMTFFTVLVASVLFTRIVVECTTNIRFLLLSSALLFVTGRLGFGTLSSVQAAQTGGDDLAYLSLVTMRELFEICGALLLNYGLARHIAEVVGGLTLRVAPEIMHTSKVVPIRCDGRMAVNDLPSTG